MKSNNHTDKDKLESNLNKNKLVKNRIDLDTLFADIDDDSEKISENGDILSDVDKISQEICTKILLLQSIKTNNKNNRIMETTKFTKSELNAIANRLNAIHSHGSEDLSLKDRLVSYYMTTDEGLAKDEAEQTVSRLMTGVDDLTSKYKAALENGWNPNEHIAEMTACMTTQERYDFLVNAISIVMNLNVNILVDSADIKGDVEATIAEIKANNAEVTDATCASLQASLAELLESSPLMLTGEDKIKEMMDAARGESTNVIDFASSEYDDYRYKNEMALAVWIEHKEGNVTSLPDGILPESLGVSIAAGVEEAHILDEVTSGNKSWEWAVKCIKVLGGIALVCFLGYIALLGLAFVACSFFEAAILVMGSSSVAIFIATALSFLVSWGYCEVLIKFGTKVVNWCGEAYCWAMDKLKEHVWPYIKKGANKIVNWWKNKFGKNDNSDEKIYESSSDEVNNDKTYNNNPNTLKLSENEVKHVSTLVEQFIASQDKDKTLKENLVDFYLNQFPGIHPKNAEGIVDGFIKGITLFNDTLSDALRQDIEKGKVDFTSHLLKLTEEMSPKEKYEIYLNYLSLLTVIEKTNLNLNDMSFTSSINDIKDNLATIDEDPTDEMIEDVLDKINELLNNSSICISSIQVSRDLLSNLNADELECSLIDSQESDMRHKLIMSTMTYIAIKNGTITSVSDKDITPESIALGVSAGIEEQKVLADLSQNKISESKAIKVLKIIGGVLMVTSLIVATLVAITYGTTAIFFGVFTLLGEGIIASIVAGIATVVVGYGIAGLAMVFGEKVLRIADKMFDKIVKFFEENVSPASAKLVKKITHWLKDKLGIAKDVNQDNTNDIINNN